MKYGLQLKSIFWVWLHFFPIVQFVDNLCVCRDEAAHTWENERDGGVDVQERAPGYREVQSCVGERPGQPGEVQKDGHHGTERPQGTSIVQELC